MIPLRAAEVAPISIPASASAISLMNPSLPGPWIQPRDEDGIEPDHDLARCTRLSEVPFLEATG